MWSWDPSPPSSSSSLCTSIHSCQLHSSMHTVLEAVVTSILNPDIASWKHVLFTPEYTMTSKRTCFFLQRTFHDDIVDLEVPSALQRWNELKLIDTICVSTKFLFHRFPHKKKHVPYISIAVSLFKSMIKLCKSGFVATLSADLVLRSRHRWCPLSNWRSSSRLKKLLVCFDTQEKTIILLKSACDSGVSTKKWREDTRPNETSKFTCYCGMGKTAWLAKLQSVLMLCMQCPLFTPTLRPAKSKETKPTTKKTCGVSQSFVLKTSSSSDFCSHCVHPAAVCLITSFSRSFSFTSSAPTSSSPTCAARSGTAGNLFLYGKNKMNFL